MRSGGLAWPTWAYFTCSSDTHCDDEIHIKWMGTSKLTPRFTAKVFQRDANRPYLLQCKVIDLTGRMATGGKCLKAALSRDVKHRFGHDTAGKIAGAQNECDVGRVARGTSFGRRIGLPQWD